MRGICSGKDYKFKDLGEFNMKGFDEEINEQELLIKDIVNEFDPIEIKIATSISPTCFVGSIWVNTKSNKCLSTISTAWFVI